MLGYREALERVLDSVAPLPPRRVPLGEALGRVAAEEVVAADPVPPFTNSGMDGFAVRAADVEGAREDAPVGLRVVADLPAGQVAACHVTPGTALRIMTGAPLPGGADAVVPVEWTTATADRVEVRRPVKRGANVRPAGEDVPAGARVVERNAVLRAGDIGVLAEVGHTEVTVIPRATIAVITTGDELVDASERPDRGRIRDSNIYAVCAQAAAFGAASLAIPRVADRRADMQQALLAAAAAADVIVTTGGISMGAFDCVKDALEALAAERVFWRVAQKPAGPLGFWRLGGVPVFGMPGNPVAAMIVMEEYVRPALRKMMSLPRLFRPERHATLEAAWERRESDRRLHFLRVVGREEGGAWRARLAGPQGSGILSSMARANALALVPEDARSLQPGAQVLLHLIEEPEDH
jgi:molybdopterin molybdotransferase